MVKTVPKGHLQNVAALSQYDDKNIFFSHSTQVYIDT